MKKGLLFVISGPSGVGKGSIRELIIDDESLNFHYSRDYLKFVLIEMKS